MGCLKLLRSCSTASTAERALWSPSSAKFAHSNQKLCAIQHSCGLVTVDVHLHPNRFEVEHSTAPVRAGSQLHWLTFSNLVSLVLCCTCQYGSCEVRYFRSQRSVCMAPDAQLVLHEGCACSALKYCLQTRKSHCHQLLRCFCSLLETW